MIRPQEIFVTCVSRLGLQSQFHTQTGGIHYAE
jgi:hypothetical protein